MCNLCESIFLNQLGFQTNGPVWILDQERLLDKPQLNEKASHLFLSTSILFEYAWTGIMRFPFDLGLRGEK